MAPRRVWEIPWVECEHSWSCWTSPCACLHRALFRANWAVLRVPPPLRDLTWPMMCLTFFESPAVSPCHVCDMMQMLRQSRVERMTNGRCPERSNPESKRPPYRNLPFIFPKSRSARYQGLSGAFFELYSRPNCFQFPLRYESEHKKHAEADKLMKEQEEKYHKICYFRQFFGGKKPDFSRKIAPNFLQKENKTLEAD